MEYSHDHVTEKPEFSMNKNKQSISLDITELMAVLACPTYSTSVPVVLHVPGSHQVSPCCPRPLFIYLQSVQIKSAK